MLVGLIGFGLGKASDHSFEPLKQEMATIVYSQATVVQPDTSGTAADLPQEAENSAYVASKNGTKYHLPWCPGASQMKEENKVWFATVADARAAGYEPAANCPGL